jgi:transcriptional regulator GlxA family with amidase domain
MKRIGLVVFPGFQILDMAAASVFEMANLHVGAWAYDIDVVSEDGGVVKSSMGAAVQTIALDPHAYDTLIVAGPTTLQPSSPELLRLLERALEPTRRIASTCTGAFILADAGILHARRATTHWRHARELQRRFPSIRVEEDRIFVRDGRIWTSAGATACIDLALEFVEQDLGVEVSRAVAKKLVVHHRRAGGQSQFSMLSELESKSDRIQAALTYARNHLHEELSVQTLAQAANMSPRHFSREFRQHTGQSPARAIERLRAETARMLVEADTSTIERIASKTGFSDPERMRRAFLRSFGEPPQALKRAARRRRMADSAPERFGDGAPDGDSLGTPLHRTRHQPSLVSVAA